MLWRGASALTLSWLRCIARRTASVVVALPWRTWPIARPSLDDPAVRTSGDGVRLVIPKEIRSDFARWIHIEGQPLCFRCTLQVPQRIAFLKRPFGPFRMPRPNVMAPASNSGHHQCKCRLCILLGRSVPIACSSVGVKDWNTASTPGSNFRTTTRSMSRSSG